MWNALKTFGDYLKLTMFAFFTQPTNPARIGQGVPSPEGLRLVHCAATVAEAEMLRQLLSEEGFHVEHVPSTSTGVFGTTGNSSVYVRDDQFESAQTFLEEYLSAEPIMEEEEGTDL